VKGGEGALLVADVDQHRPRGRHVDGLVRDAGQVLCRGGHEPGAVKPPARGHDFTASLEQRLRDVGKDHRAADADAVECFECDQAVTGADIEQRRAVERLGISEHTVTNVRESRQRGGSLLLATSVPTLENPSRPTIGFGRHIATLYENCDELDRLRVVSP
jgi:hypothetical protein